MKKNLFRALCLLMAFLFLPVPAMASSFNANDFAMNGSGDSFTVTIGESNDVVLQAEAAAGRTAQATVACSYDKAFVLHGNEIMESSLENGEITFAIPSAGDYEIIYDTRFAIANTNMVFGNSLAMNFWIRKSDIQGTGYEAVITKYYSDGRAPVETRVPFSQWEDYNSSYYRVCCNNIAAKEMSDDVTVQILKDGTIASYLYTDSVRSYAMDMLKYYSSGKLATALVDMLNYGAAAQAHFEYGEDDLANSLLSEAQKALATESVTAENIQEKGERYVGNTLMLNSNIVLNLYFRNVTEDMYAEVGYTDHYGRARTQTVPYEKFVDMTFEGTALKGVSVDTLVVADGRKPVTCTLYNGEGAAVGSCVSSVESYIAQMMGKDPLYENTLKFVDSAYAYFHS